MNIIFIFYIIIYDKLFLVDAYNSHSKTEICLEYNIYVMIEDKVDNINYTLKIKKNIIDIVIFLYLSILILYLTNYLIKYFIINNKIHFTKIDYQNKFYHFLQKLGCDI